jgi:amidase
MKQSNQLSAREAARRIACRELSAEALVRACLERIEEREAVVGAWIQLDADAALAEARALDAGALRGPLHGLPVAVKDLIDTVQYPTAYGSPIYAGYRPPADASCVAVARAAGALVLGKTVTTEFATFSPGKTANPHNPLHTPGGSSSGSAAAVADFMAPLAYGTQTAGSVIRPAAYCGVVGYKPSFGLICRAGVKPMAESLDTVGVLARDVGDAAFFAGVLAGRDLQPPATPATPRVGLCRTAEWEQAEPATRDALESAAGSLSAAGARVQEITLASEFSRLVVAQSEIMAYEIARALAYEAQAHAAQLSAKLHALLAQGRAVTPARHDDNLRLAERCRRALADQFAGVDVLLTPSTTGEAPAGLDATGNPLFNRLWTLLGAPCVHLPSARGPNGLPVGVQLVGLVGDDRKTLAAADWAWAVLAP